MPKYENQNNYPNTPYPSGELPGATVKSGGCGCVSSVNVLRFFGINVTVPDMAKIFVNKGIRVNGGTDMNKAAKYLKDTYELEYVTTNDESMLQTSLQNGCIAIANCDGDIGSKGIFSSGGHFFNIAGYDNQPPKPFICFDVGYYDGKFDSAYRKQYVSVSKDDSGNVIQFTSKEALNIDTAYNSPQYWIFSKKGEDIDMEELKKLQEQVAGLTDTVNQLAASMDKLANPMIYNWVDKNMPEWARQDIQELIDEGLLTGTDTGLHLNDDLLRTLVILNRMRKKLDE